MHRIPLACCLAALLGLALDAPVYGAPPEGERPDQKGVEFFEKHIRPVLVKHCYECHSAESKDVKAGLVLDSREGTRTGGDSGAAVVPGKPDESLLMEALRWESYEMPPQEPLPAEVVADFARWIEMGAPDPRDGETAQKVEKAERLWSLEPVADVQPPEVADAAWPANGIDRFVLARLEAAGIEPAADAGPAQLLRRVYYDLVGLPPTPEELDAFLADPSAEAYAEVVDRLLESPQFGERWGRHWLDVARFAESNGKDRDRLFPHAWRYRNWVIDAVNADLPYDRFIAAQVAGDLLPHETQEERDRQLVATGFLAVGPKSLTQRGETFRMNLVDDQIDATSRAVLGLTVSCARCHDHKFDPIPTKDYYALAGIFRSTETLFGSGIRNNGKPADNLQPLGPPEDVKKYEEHQGRITAANKQLAAERKKVQNLQAKAKKLREAKKKAQAEGGESEAKKEEQGAKENEKSAEGKQGEGGKKAEKPQAKKDGLAEVQEQIQATQKQVNELQQRLKELRGSSPPRPDYAMAVRDEKKPADLNVLVRGEINKKGEPAPRGFLSQIKLEREIKVDKPQSGRLQLAEWLTDGSNPLTPRVAVNRMWHHLFGRGIVETVDNFGTNGARPTHPELLDWLARRFVENGWSRKGMTREIVLSRTYRLGSEHDEAKSAADPENRLLWRRGPRRLEVEAIRDTMLAASGKLDLSRPERSPVAQIGEGEVGRGINTKPLEAEFNHRSVYLPILRTLLPEILRVFDFPEPSIVVGRRVATTVPAQALYLMNSPLVIKQSDELAARLLADESLDDAGRVRLAYKLCLARPATEAEVQRAVEFVQRAGERLEDKEVQKMRRAAWATFAQALFASGEFRYVE